MEKENHMMQNKGFSLVELIVVVLIMAIIAVALAPQILKWVNNSRISTDMQTKDSLVDLMQMTVLTNEAVNAVAVGHGAVLTICNDPDDNTFETSSGTTYVGTSDDDLKPLFERFSEYAGTNDIKDFRTKVKGAKIIVTVNDTATTISSEYLDESGSAIEIDD